MTIQYKTTDNSAQTVEFSRFLLNVETETKLTKMKKKQRGCLNSSYQQRQKEHNEDNGNNNHIE